MSASRFAQLATLTVILAMLAACATANSVAPRQAENAATASASPTANVVVLVATVTDTAQAAASVTPLAPGTSPAPTATPTPEISVTPSTTPAGQIGPAGFPSNVNPLTGLAVADPAVLDRRPVAIKISNSPDCVRPQHGIGLADIVFEHYAEGGVTRFTAVFYGNDAGTVGSVRSARLIDLELPAMYQSLFAFSGASGPVKQLIADSDFFPYVLSPDFVPGHPAFFRKDITEVRCDLFEHTLFTSTDRLWVAAEAAGVNQRPVIEGLAFNSAPPTGGQPAAEAEIRYIGSYVYWGYNADQGTYYRVNNGATHTDALTGQTVTAANVVVVYVNHVTTLILENMIGYDPNTNTGGGYSVEIQLWGSGPARLFRDGQSYDVNWVRFDRNGPLALTTDDGALVPLKPGNTWYQLVPLEASTTFSGDNAWQVVAPRPSPEPER